MDNKKQEAYEEIVNALQDELKILKDGVGERKLTTYQIGFLDGIQQAINVCMPIVFRDALKPDKVDTV